MAISRDISDRIKDLLRSHPEGLSITDIVKVVPINRNTASRYLDTLLVSGQVEMRHFGMAKIYTLSQRLPVASVLSISSEYILQVDQNLRVIFMNRPFLDLLGLKERDVIGKRMDYTPVPAIFDDEYAKLHCWITEALSGLERRNELRLPGKERILACKATPAVFTEGQKGVSVILEDITTQREDEERLRESEEKFRTLVEASTDGILVSTREGMVMVWNQALTRITGIPREDALGKPLTEIMVRCLVPERRSRQTIDAITTGMRTAIRTGYSRTFFQPMDIEIVRPGGEHRFIQMTTFPIETSKGALVGSVIHDETERRQMLAEITEREERFRALFNNSADMITLHGFGPDGLPSQFIEVNEIATRRLGYTREELLRMSPKDLIDPSCLQTMQENAGKVRATGSAVFDLLHVAKDGRRIPVEIRSSFIEYKGSSLVLAQVRDISRRKEAEAAIREGQERLELALSGSDTGMWELDIPTMTGRIDERAAQILGYQKVDIGTNKTDWDSLTHPDDVPLITRRLMDCLAGRTTSFESEHRMHHASGEWIWMSGRGKITHRLPDGSPLRISGTLQDITNRKLAEAALETSEAHLRTIIRTAPVGIGMVARRVLLEVNNQMCGMTGYTAEELVGHSVRMLYLSQQEFDRVWAEAYRGVPAGGTGSVETVWKRKDGRTIDILLSLTSLSPSDPETGFVFTALDITSRKRAEAAIRSSEERARNLLERSFDAVIIHKQGTIVMANDAALALAGAVSPEDLVGSDLGRFIHPDSRQLIQERIAEMLRAPGTTMPLVREKFLKLNGETLEVEVMATGFLDEGVPAIQVVFREVTDTVRMEDRLRRSEEIYRTVAESATDVICVIDPDGLFVYANASCARMLGFSQDDLTGRRLEDQVPPEMARRHHENVRKVIATGIPYEHEEIFPTAAGEKRLDIKLSPIKGPDGTVISVVVIARDITRRTTRKQGRPGRKTS